MRLGWIGGMARDMGDGGWRVRFLWVIRYLYYIRSMSAYKCFESLIHVI